MLAIGGVHPSSFVPPFYPPQVLNLARLTGIARNFVEKAEIARRHVPLSGYQKYSQVHAKFRTHVALQAFMT